jgi:hypothetical protein
MQLHSYDPTLAVDRVPPRHMTFTLSLASSITQRGAGLHKSSAGVARRNISSGMVAHCMTCIRQVLIHYTVILQVRTRGADGPRRARGLNIQTTARSLSAALPVARMVRSDVTAKGYKTVASSRWPQQMIGIHIQKV